MDKNIEILLNSTKNSNSVNVDNYDKIELSNKSALITEYDIKNVLSATEIFDAERETNQVYRIYGKIEYLSLLNGLKRIYNNIEYFFNPQTTDAKNILNSFDFYLVKPSTGYTIGNSMQYTRYFEVIAMPDNFEIYSAGFSNNIYGEQTYAFNFNVDIDVSDFYDDFGFPVTELFLYIQYIPKLTELIEPETLFFTEWSITGIPSKSVFTPTIFNIGDIVQTFFGVKIGDLIQYSKPDFLQTDLQSQTYYIQTSYKDDNNITQSLVWKYNPFISLRLRYFSNDLYKANTGSTSYEQQISIPNYATDIGDDNRVWRNILPQGFIDPLTNIGVDYPFVNKRRYLFQNIIFDIIPDLTDNNTFNVFNEIKFDDAVILNKIPMGDINNIGKPCQ